MVRDVAGCEHYAYVKTPRIVVFVTIAGLVAGPRRGPAQQMTGIPEVDSAAVARAAWGRAAKALSQDDVSVARREVERAAESWPKQSAYLWADAVLAARAGDTATTLHALAAYADLGLGRDLRGEPFVARLATLPSFARVVAVHDAHRAPVIHSRARGSLPDSSFWPEGVDYDGRTDVSTSRASDIARSPSCDPTVPHASYSRAIHARSAPFSAFASTRLAAWCGRRRPAFRRC